MKIGIIGNGVVGNATGKAFEGANEVRCTDRLRARETHILPDVLECDIIFICLPTPQKEGSLACDTSAIDGFFQHGLPERFRNANFVIKSTVPIGYTRKARERFDLPNLVHSPEFLTARTASLDAAMPARNIIGSATYSEREKSNIGSAAYALRRLYMERWPHVPVIEITSDESEAVKLMQNSFSAVKIAVFNEFRALADKLGLDWERVRGALLAGGWINPMHTQVPGPDGRRGFGGACLPKDLANLIDCTVMAGQTPIVREGDHIEMVSLLMAAYDRNRLVDRKETA